MGWVSSVPPETNDSQPDLNRSPSPSWSAKADHPRVFVLFTDQYHEKQQKNVDGRPSPTMTVEGERMTGKASQLGIPNRCNRANRRPASVPEI
jgi:hypothetical protein